MTSTELRPHPKVGARHRLPPPPPRRGWLSMRPIEDAPRAELAEWSVVAVIAGLVGAALPAGGLVGGPLLIVFVVAGPGLALLALLRLPTVLVVAGSAPTGIAVVGSATALLAQFGRFPTWGLLAALSVATVGLAAATPRPGGSRIVARLRRAASVRNPPPRPSARAAVAVLAAAACWLVALPLVTDVPYSQFGLLASRGGPLLVAAAVIVLGMFLVSIRRGRLRAALVATLAMIVVLRLTVSIVTPEPIYGWTYKHIGVSEFIRQFHELPPRADIYGQWPSLFTMTAWFADLSHVDMVTLAHWFTPGLHIVLLLVVIALARTLGSSRRVALTAGMLAELLNWVGQDYFAPQAIAFPLAVFTLAAAVYSRQRPRAGLLALGGFAALVPMHQLTPFWVVGVLVVLTVTGRIKPRWIVLACLFLLAAYVIPRYDTVRSFGVISGFNPLKNASSNFQAQNPVLGKVVTSAVCRSLSAGAFLWAGVSMLVLRRRHATVWPSTVIAGAAVLLLAGQSYGGEAIFRVFLYSIPGLVTLIAPGVVAAIRHRRPPRSTPGRIRSVAVVVLLVAALVGGMQGYFGLWGQVRVTPLQLTTAARIMERPGLVRVVPLFASGLPTRVSAAYVEKDRLFRGYDSAIVGANLNFFAKFPLGGQLRAIEDLAVEQTGRVYIAITPEDVNSLLYYGYLSALQLDTFDMQLRTSPRWRYVVHSPELHLFEFIG